MIDVVLIDDDVDDAYLIKRAFSDFLSEFNFVHYRDGALFIDSLTDETDKQRLLLLDINMPRVNGYSVLKQLRKTNRLKYFHVVILSTTSMEREESYARKLGAQDWITKPDTIAELKQDLRSILIKYEADIQNGPIAP